MEIHKEIMHKLVQILQIKGKILLWRLYINDIGIERREYIIVSDPVLICILKLGGGKMHIDQWSSRYPFIANCILNFIIINGSGTKTTVFIASYYLVWIWSIIIYNS